MPIFLNAGYPRDSHFTARRASRGKGSGQGFQGGCPPLHDNASPPWDHGVADGHPPPLYDIPSGCCSFTGPWTVTRSSLRMLRRVAAFCWPLRPVLLLVSFPRSRSPGFGVLGLC